MHHFAGELIKQNPLARGIYTAPRANFHYERARACHLRDRPRRNNEVFPGLPNFQSISTGDEAEHCWILHLITPVDRVVDKPDEINQTERVRTVQLLLNDSDRNKISPKTDKPQLYSLTGTLFHGHTGHHHTQVLMKVDSLTVTK